MKFEISTIGQALVACVLVTSVLNVLIAIAAALQIGPIDYRYLIVSTALFFASVTAYGLRAWLAGDRF